MALTNKLINATPFNVKINYNRGIKIFIPSDGEVQLTMEQLDDYRPGKPGSEGTKKDLDYHGLFLLDSDRAYDPQALEALKKSVRAKEELRKNFITSSRNNRIQAGHVVDDETLEEVCEQAGHGYKHPSATGYQIEKLKKRISILSEVASEVESKTKVTFNPELTCFGLDAPREFPSKTALAMFLSEQSEDVLEKHLAMVESFSEVASAE